MMEIFQVGNMHYDSVRSLHWDSYECTGIWSPLHVPTVTILPRRTDYFTGIESESIFVKFLEGCRSMGWKKISAVLFCVEYRARILDFKLLLK